MRVVSSDNKMTEKAHLERKILLEINQKKKQHRKQMQSCI